MSSFYIGKCFLLFRRDILIEQLMREIDELRQQLAQTEQQVTQYLMVYNYRIFPNKRPLPLKHPLQ